MKKIALFFTLVCFLSAIQAQEETQRVQLSARIGLSGTTLLIPNSTISAQYAYGYNTSKQMKLGVSAGLIADIHLKNKLFLQTGLMYGWQRLHQVQTAVFEKESHHLSIATENMYKMNRIKIPLMLYYHTSLENNHFVVGAGLFADIALSGKIIYDASCADKDPHGSITNYVASGHFDPFLNDTKYLYYHIANDDFTNKYSLYHGNILNRFKWGIAAEAGYQVSKFYFGAHVDFGLANMMNPKFAGEDYKERLFSFQIMVGYKIY